MRITERWRLSAGSVTDAADLAKLHLLGRPLLGWFLMSVILEIRVFRRLHFLLILALTAFQFLNTVIELVARVVGDTALLFLLRGLWRVDFCGKVGLQGRGLGRAVGLSKRTDSTDATEPRKKVPPHKSKIQNTWPKRLVVRSASMADVAFVAEPHFMRRASFGLLFVAKIAGI
jgi:hypothetical protein